MTRRRAKKHAKKKEKEKAVLLLLLLLLLEQVVQQWGEGEGRWRRGWGGVGWGEGVAECARTERAGASDGG